MTTDRDIGELQGRMEIVEITLRDHGSKLDTLLAGQARIETLIERGLHSPESCPVRKDVNGLLAFKWKLIGMLVVVAFVFSVIWQKVQHWLSISPPMPPAR